METKKLLTILVVVLATMVVSLTSFIVGMYIPRPGVVGGNPAAVEQPDNGPQPQKPVLPGKKPSEYRVGKSYSDAMQGEAPVIAVFYVDWCHFCQSFMPKFQELSKMYRGKMVFSAVNSEDPKNVEAVKEYAIKAFPTVYIINPKTKEKEEVTSNNFVSIETMKGAIDSYLQRHGK